ncbi:hypothetical protein JNUCC0626_20170 [Lentzea sp. JNUCC 0626]|uniref:hypothetical protein n=1 Tax=Lentzea sp. JNUCC 0626 TaxID=3367513 RepID=UPI003748C913
MTESDKVPWTASREHVLNLFRSSADTSYTRREVVAATKTPQSTVALYIGLFQEAGWLSVAWVAEPDPTSPDQPIRCWRITQAGRDAWQEHRQDEEAVRT